MVGYLSPPRTEEEDTSSTVTIKNGQDTKPKSSIDSNLWDNFDFDHWASEADRLAIPLADSFLDFDSIKEWMEEMQVPESCQSKQQAEVCLNSWLSEGQEFRNMLVNNEASGGLIEDEGGGAGRNSVVEHCDGATAQGGKAEQPDGMELKVGFTGFDHVLAVPVNGPCDVMLTSTLGDVGDKFVQTGGAEELQDLSSAVEDRMGQVSLTDGVKSSSLEEHRFRKSEIGIHNKASFNEALNSAGVKLGDGSGNGTLAHGLESSSVKANCKKDCKIKNDDDSESSDSSAESSSSSSSSSSNESSDDDCEVTGGRRGGSNEVVVKTQPEDLIVPDEVEEGEIIEADADKMVSWSHDSDNDNGSDMDDAIEDEIYEECFGDDDDAAQGPIKSKNELSMLPPVPPVDVVLQPSHQLSPVGAIMSIMGAQVVVEGSEKHNPLSEGSILWVSETRSPLGRVDEIFGPVKNPFYIVRFNSEDEVPSSLCQGTLVSFVSEFVDHVLNERNLYQKGYDASGENDEEATDEVEFSDDEKEAEYRRMMKQSKRAIIDLKSRENKKKKDRQRRNGKPPVWNTHDPSNPAKHCQGFQSHSETSMGLITQGSQPYPFGMSPFPPSGQGVRHPFPQPRQQPLNPASFQQGHNMAPPGGFQQADNMPSPGGFQQGNNMPSPGGFQRGSKMPSPGGFQQGNNMPSPSGFQQGNNMPILDRIQPGNNMPFSGGLSQGSNNMAFSNGFQPDNNELMKQPPPAPLGQQTRPFTMPFMNTTAQPLFQPPGGHNQNMTSPYGQHSSNPNLNPNSNPNPNPNPQYQQPVGHKPNMSVPFGHQGFNPNPSVNTAAQPPFQQPGGHNQNMIFGQQGPNPNPNSNPSLNRGQGFPSWPAAQPVPNMPNQAQLSQGLSALLAQQLSTMPGFLPLLLQQGFLSSGPGGQNINMPQQMLTSFGLGSEASRPLMFNQAFLSSGQGGLNSSPQQQIPTNFASNGEASRLPMLNQGVSPSCMPQMSASFTSSNEVSPLPHFNQGETSGGPGGKRPFHNNRSRGGGRQFRGRGGGRRGRNHSR